MAIRLGLSAVHVFLSPVGFARVGRMIALGLEDLGVDVRLANTQNPKYDGIISKEEFDRLRSLTQKTFDPDIWLSLSPGCGVLKNVKGWNIALSMWETPRLPGFGAKLKHVNEVWVPSPFNWKVFHESETSQVPKEHLAYMPLGVDTDFFSPGPSSVTITDSFETKFDFVYGIVCGYSERKGVSLILTAHHELFDTSSNVALLIQGDKHGQRLFPQDLASIYRGDLLGLLSGTTGLREEVTSKVVTRKPTILCNFDPLSNHDLVNLLRAMDGFVFPSRGEGFGLPPLEAMSCELPVIGTADHGMKEFMLPDISYPVPSGPWKLSPRCDWITPDYRGHLFADPNYEVYRDAVWEMYTNRDAAKIKGKKARKFVIRHYSFPIVLNRMKRRLEEIAGGKLTTENFWP